MTKMKIAFQSSDCDEDKLIIHTYEIGSGLIQIESGGVTLGYMPNTVQELGDIIAALSWIYEERELDSLYLDALEKDD
jgi:hypothetical protein